jgi:hypothetical protein
MCDVFQDKYDHGFREGRAEGIEIGKSEGIEIGEVNAYVSSAVSFIKETGMPAEKVLSMMSIPDDLRPEVASKVQEMLSS